MYKRQDVNKYMFLTGFGILDGAFACLGDALDNGVLPPRGGVLDVGVVDSRGD